MRGVRGLVRFRSLFVDGVQVVDLGWRRLRRVRHFLLYHLAIWHVVCHEV